ncbi:MAG: hypothetical protein JNL89_00350, partial [Rhodanobacteraceae bacterium]|nr:hypothetical protein [Rhodanobacteraceae bacterium]
MLGPSPAHRSSGASAALRGDTPIAIVGIGACLGRAMDLPAVAAALFGEARIEARMEAIELDLAGLRFPPKDLEQALPQQLAMLRAAREALAASGPLPPRSSVLVGMEPDAEIARYGTRWRSADAAAKDGVIAPLEAAGVLGCMPNIPANRLSSQFDCGGPSYTLQAGADSGLVALRIAARALAHGEIDAALVGAVDLCDQPVNRAAGNADPGDAAVALVLRRLADAERDGQRVLALVGGQPVGAGSTRDLLAFPTRDRGHSPLPQERAPATDFGAAAGLLHALHATLRLHHRRHADGRPWLGAATRTVELPLPGMPGIQLSEARGHRRVCDTPTPRLHLYAGADRAAVVANLRADRPGGEGPARLVLVARDDEWADVRQRALAHLE